MISYRTLAAIFLGLAIVIQGFCLVYDPWAKERTERFIRETTRLHNSYYRFVNDFVDAFPEVGLFLVLAGACIMNRFKTTFVIGLIALGSLGYIHHSNIIYKSERFGGIYNIHGQLFYLAAISTTILTCFDLDQAVRFLISQFDKKAKIVTAK